MADPASTRRPYKACNSERTKTTGIVVASLEELKEKASFKLAIEPENCRVFIEQDGTEVDDNEYFGFLDDQTKFMIVADGEEWTLGSQNATLHSQGSYGIFNASLERNESVEIDGTDAGKTVDSISPDLLLRIKNDPAFFISFSDESLQDVINFDGGEFAIALGESAAEAEHKQEACQHELDRRTEFREATQLLKLLEKAHKSEITVGNKRQRTAPEQ